jgi:hypothetical protein
MLKWARYAVCRAYATPPPPPFGVAGCEIDSPFPNIFYRTNSGHPSSTIAHNLRSYYYGERYS